MEQDQEAGLSLFLVFGVIVIGAIALYTRIRESRKRYTEKSLAARKSADEK
jgi:hypothetical protein